MKKHIFFGLLLSLPLYGMNTMNEAASHIDAAQENNSVRRLNSLMEAYMAGRLQANTHHADSSLTYEELLKNAHRDFYHSRRLINPDGKVINYINVLKANYKEQLPKEAVDENGNLQPGWKLQILFAD